MKCGNTLLFDKMDLSERLRVLELYCAELKKDYVPVTQAGDSSERLCALERDYEELKEDYEDLKTEYRRLLENYTEMVEFDEYPL